VIVFIYIIVCFDMNGQQSINTSWKTEKLNIPTYDDIRFGIGNQINSAVDVFALE